MGTKEIGGGFFAELLLSKSFEVIEVLNFPDGLP